MTELNTIKETYDQGKVSEALELLNSFTGEKNILYWQLMGNIKQKMQQFGEAINAFQKILDIEPDNKEASLQLEIINNILNFWNPEMFNP